MKKKIVLAVCVAMIASFALTGCTPEPTKETTTTAVTTEAVTTQEETTIAETEAPTVPNYNYKDGTYTGSARGMGGEVTVTITVSGGMVTVDEIVAPYETPGIGGKEAVEDGTFKAQIEAVQTAEIEGITGATMTSGGVRKAVAAALAQAK